MKTEDPLIGSTAGLPMKQSNIILDNITNKIFGNIIGIQLQYNYRLASQSYFNRDSDSEMRTLTGGHECVSRLPFGGDISIER